MGKFLKELSKPIDLEVCHGSTEREKNIVKIETLNVQRAREFRDIYEGLVIDDDSENEASDEQARVEQLFSLKKIASQHTCPASSSLENLIDQELFLLSTRVESSHLRHLRSRVKLGFLRLAHGALHHDNRIKSKYSTWTRLCPSCGKLRSFEAFEVDHRGRLSRTCIDCVTLRVRDMDPKVYSNVYERMLKQLRRSEALRINGSSSPAFILSIDTISYLVNNIWHGRSAISECSDLERLRLVRFDPRVSWSPWNNLLATRHEARMHEALAWDSLESAYDLELLRKFRRLNLQAWFYFKPMTNKIPNKINSCL